MKKAAKGQARPVEIPDDLQQALQDHPASREAFERLPPSHQREYIDWIEEAQKETTRQGRIEKTLAKLLAKQ
jgi:uncharacterized protein YdeI (YjbR/CyaY-like superfamily)